MGRMINVVPGGSVVIRLQVRKYDGTLANLDGGTVSTNLHSSGATDEPVSQVIEVDAQTRLAVVSAAQTLARPGRQIKGRAFITPAGSYETVPAEFYINVASQP